MQLGEMLCRLGGARTSIVLDAPLPDHAKLLSGLEDRQTDLRSAVADSDTRLEENQAHQQQSEKFRGRVKAFLDSPCTKKNRQSRRTYL